MPVADGMAHELFRDAEMMGMVQAAAVVSSLVQRYRVAVGDAMQSLADVESHIEPQAFTGHLLRNDGGGSHGGFGRRGMEARSFEDPGAVPLMRVARGSALGSCFFWQPLPTTLVLR